jgi:pimeloyl-ACP methyl ester carboxylesterase
MPVILVALGFLFFLIIVGPFLVPVQSLTGTEPLEQLAAPESQFVDINGLKIHVEVMGEGDPVFILLHGFGASLFSWHAVTESLSQHGKVIAYDHPAFGFSGRPMAWSGEDPYSSWANVELLQKLLDFFKIHKAFLIGNSVGGTLSMQYTLQHPERVRGLILVASAVYRTGYVPSWLRLLFRTPQLNHLGPLIVRSK